MAYKSNTVQLGSNFDQISARPELVEGFERSKTILRQAQDEREDRSGSLAEHL